MGCEKRYKEMYQALMAEHEAVFEKQDTAGIDKLLDDIAGAKRIFVTGIGRLGISLRAFAMRLEHMGWETHWLWDDTTPGMGEGDLFITSNGSGSINHMYHVYKKAKESGARIAFFTEYPEGETSALADTLVTIPGQVFHGRNPESVKSFQPMGNLFEQHLLLLCDIIIMLLQEKTGITSEMMEARHRNVE